jgi:phage terminase large subunit
MKTQLQLTKKQREAWLYLTDNKTNEILFGGGAGGAKSYIGCAWIIYNCIQYPGTRWLIGRAVLKSLKETTLNTFFEVLKAWGLTTNEFKYNSIEGTIKVSNGSEILLKDLKTYPSDPNFDSLGSLEITGNFIDEANQVTAKARNIVRSRCRYKLDEYGLIPKSLYTCNPAKNWVYSDFYKPDRDGKLPSNRKFIQALAGDNPFISKHYIQNLLQLDQNTRERLLYGNWEYDDDPAKLMGYDKIVDIFTSKVSKEGDRGYISCDVARFGDDKTVIGRWEGMQLVKVDSYPRTSIDQVIAELEKLCATHSIPRSNVVVDEDGVGGGVVDGFKGCRGFVNNSRAIQKKRDKNQKNYANLKTQCYFELARFVNEGKIGVEGITIEDKEKLIAELEQIKQKDIDKDSTIKIIGKDVIKQNIGRSPDNSDMLMMRMIFEINKKPIIRPFFY